jgi:hypothetical protein
MLLALTICLIIGAEPPKEPTLRQELLQRMQEDQDARKTLLGQKQGDLQSLKRLNEIDHKNTTRMKEIVKQYGWPGKSLVGIDGAQAAWIMVQHADHDRPFQKDCLGLLAEAFSKGEATGEQVAYLTDRVRVGQKEKQIYGTQLREVEGKFQPAPIEGETNVDERRKKMGLMPLAEYLKLSAQLLQKGDKKDK